ncbi:RNA polymerase II mediator complex subunit [Tritrichomonas musculus]|uniref:Mediator of RNA polymerase II transcription subunit 10 n=1 Tax=Tritrichomonas musculus TaxID=1915356 RepID=A0ABR2L9M8_9EUKA
MANDEADAALVKLLEQLNDSMNDLASFCEEKRKPLYKNLQGIIESFKTLETLSQNKQLDGSIPLGLVNHIDQGINPDEYAQKLVSEVQSIQENVLKKQKWMQYLKDSLDPLIELNFPDAPKNSDQSEKAD